MQRRMEDLSGRVAVVIGGGSGIGRGIALGLATEEMRVVVADIDAGSAEGVRDEIAGAGGTATAAQVDGTDRQSLGRLAEATVAEHGAVHVLSTNVGVVADRPLATTSETDWAWIIEFNLLSAVRAVDVFLPSLRAAGSAHIVITASLAALLAPPSVSGVHLGPYTATKHALLGYAESLRGELAGEGVGVSLLCPGMVRSNLVATSARHRPARHGGPLPPPLAGEPPGTLMSPEEVGPVVVRGIRSDRLHILTHPAGRRLVEARHAALVEDFTFFADGGAMEDPSVKQ
jgi:NAD(P)-dependent dehydrogenase (short-subunit alcohol dehydrogenase family)